MQWHLEAIWKRIDRARFLPYADDMRARERESNACWLKNITFHGINNLQNDIISINRSISET
jgi:hypothetical protein